MADRTRTTSPLPFAVGANALAQFAIQAWLAWGFAAHVWRLPGPLPFAVPFALDAFVVNMMIVAYELRTARRRTRLYVWCVLGGGITAQVGAAEAFASHQGWAWSVRLAAIFPALFLAGSLHTMIVRRAHVAARADGPARRTPGTAAVSRPAVAAPYGTPAVTPPVADAGIRLPKTHNRTGIRIKPDTVLAEARRLVAGGASCRDAAQQVGRSKRWVEMHTQDLRSAPSSPAIAAGVALPPNGRAGSRVELPSDLAHEMDIRAA